jgi:hypothetical protein
MRDIDAAIQIRLAIDRKKSMPVDIVVSKQSAYKKRNLSPTMERTIAEQGVLVYG